MDVNHDDPESSDAGPIDAGRIDAGSDRTFDLTPRDAGTGPAAPKRGARRYVPLVLAAAVLVGIGLMVSNLASATTYFFNVDEALARRSEIGDRRVSIQGNIVKGSVEQGPDRLKFVLKYHGKTVAVTHTGDVPDLFGPSIPVVIEGKFVGNRFESDRVLIKHDAQYQEKNSKRLKDAEKDASANAVKP